MPAPNDGRRLQKLLEHTREHIALIDADGRLIEHWSSTPEARLGYEPEELLGRCLFDYVHPVDLPRLQSVIQHILGAPGAAVPFSCRARRRDGAYRWIEGTAANLTHEPLVQAIVLNWSDVHERTEARYGALATGPLPARFFDDAPVGIIVVSMDRSIRRANPEFCSLLGYAADELRGRDIHTLLHPDDLEKARLQAEPVRLGIAPVLRTQLRLLARDGREVWVDLAAFYLRDEEERPTHVVAIFLDITPQIQARADLEASRERIRQLATFVVEAREQERASIAREIHDELAQMLTALGMQIEALAWDHASPCPHRAAFDQHLANIRALVRDSMKWAQRMAVELRPGILDQIGLLEAMKWQAQRFQENTGVACLLTLPPADPGLAPDQATTVFRVFQEALNNVARHSRATQVTVRLRELGDMLFLTVLDNGVGLPAGILHDPLAVGLIGMRERAQLHGGNLRFFSRPGRGAAATLRLPKKCSISIEIPEDV